MKSASRKVIATVASQSHIGQFAVLVDSILQHESALSVYLLVIDISEEEAGELQERFMRYANRGDALHVTILTLEQIYGSMTDTLRFCYDAFELCNIARGGLHRWLFEQTEHDVWFYIDGDMYCFGPLNGIFDQLQNHDLVLSAHRSSPCATAQEELILLMFGCYNGGLLGIRRSEVGRRFVTWFYDRMLHFGRVDTPLPVSLQPHQRFAFFADQTWLVLVPMFFDNVYILKDRSTNFGPWSLGPEESYTIGADGGAVVGDDRITLLHLSGWSAQSPNVLAKYMPRDMSDNSFWGQFIAHYLPTLEKAQQAFHRPYRYGQFADGTPISPYQRRAYLKLAMAGKQLAASPFATRTTIEGLAADFNTYDYYPPSLAVVHPDAAFPNMVEGNRHRPTSPFHRKEIPHKWYVDIHSPFNGFVSREEALLIHNVAKLFAGKPALEIGCWMGWSACHLALGGVDLDVVDPLFAEPDVLNSVRASLQAAGVADRCSLHTGASPSAVHDIAARDGKRWSLVFIDGDHSAPHPLDDTIAAEQYAAADAIMLFHDLAFPDVAHAMDYLRAKGWQTMICLTMQIMGVAWRGNVTPPRHIPDPNVTWHVPPWLSSYRISL